MSVDVIRELEQRINQDLKNSAEILTIMKVFQLYYLFPINLFNRVFLRQYLKSDIKQEKIAAVHSLR